MSMPYFNLAAATAKIDNGPAAKVATFQIGKHAFRIEKVETIWHQDVAEDHVFRVILDGKPVFNDCGNRVFVRPALGLSRHLFGGRVFFGAKPSWLPRAVTVKAANAAFDAAMLSVL